MSWTRRAWIGAVVVVVGACHDSAPPRPTTLELSAQAPASMDAGAVVAGLAVTVRDDRGNAMAGQPLAVAVAGGGVVTGAPASTLAGPTPLGSWTLGRAVGANTLTVTSGALPPLTITVQGAAGPPAKFTSATAATARSVVGRTYPFTLQLFDQYDNPTAGTVQFAITGGGTLSGGSASADATGNIPAPTWTLGTVRGPNTLTASAGGASITFTVSAEADVPASVTIASGNNQTAYAGTALAEPVVVQVTDRYGNGTPRQTVTIVTSTDGVSASPTTASTDTAGTVSVPWTLAKRNVAHQLTATVAGLAPVTASAAVRTAMPIELRFFGPISEANKQMFLGAAARLTAMIVQGTGPVNAVNFPIATACGVTGAAPITETIPGIVIYATVQPIDGPGKILAQSGPCAFRPSALRGLPAIAILEFDEADLSYMAAGGSIEDVATHEMMHSLGYGTLWVRDGLLFGDTGPDPQYTGSNGITACRGLGANVTCAAGVPVENSGGSGTKNAHWRETTFRDEIMTGYLSGVTRPMSVISISSMADLGYLTNLAAADDFLVTAGLRAAGPATREDAWERLLILPADPAALLSIGGLVTLAPGRVQEMFQPVR